MSGGGPVGDRASFLRLVDSLLDSYTPEGCLIWLRSANRHFGDRTPLEVLRDEGWQPLIDEADRLAGGPAVSRAGQDTTLREEIARELARHQGLRGPMDDERPDVWQNRCECGWDDGDEHPGWRERYRLHVADLVLALPSVRRLLDAEARAQAAEAKVARIEALCDREDRFCEEQDAAEICVAVPMRAGRPLIDRIFEAVADAATDAEPAERDWDVFVSASSPETPEVPVHLLRRALDGDA